jgi:hypothetical protein
MTENNSPDLRELDGRICMWYLLKMVTEKDRQLMKNLLEVKKISPPFFHDEDCTGFGKCAAHVDFEEIYADFMQQANKPLEVKRNPMDECNWHYRMGQHKVLPKGSVCFKNLGSVLSEIKGFRNENGKNCLECDGYQTKDKCVSYISRLEHEAQSAGGQE